MLCELYFFSGIYLRDYTWFCVYNTNKQKNHWFFSKIKIKNGDGETRRAVVRNANENENGRGISIAYTLNKMIIITFFNISSNQL